MLLPLDMAASAWATGHAVGASCHWWPTRNYDTARDTASCRGVRASNRKRAAGALHSTVHSLLYVHLSHFCLAVRIIALTAPSISSLWPCSTAVIWLIAHLSRLCWHPGEALTQTTNRAAAHRCHLQVAAAAELLQIGSVRACNLATSFD